MHKTRRGFTLIEVIVALAITIIIVLALLGIYYSYYSYVKQLTYRSIGQNLAQYLLEEVRGLSVTTIKDHLVGKPGGFYPTSWEKYKDENEDGCYEVSGSWGDGIEEAIPYPPNVSNDSNLYDSGEVPSSVRFERIESVFGVLDNHEIPEELLMGLPETVVITPVLHIDEETNEESFDYTVLLNREIFPSYTRKVVIEDLTPNIEQDERKLYRIKVTVSWYVKGVKAGSVTVEGEKSFRQ